MVMAALGGIPMSLEQSELDEIERLIMRCIANGMQNAAMKLEAVRVSSLLAENMALKLQVSALQELLQQVMAKHDGED